MSDHGILFQAPMVRALLEDRKTQTRRLLYTLRKGDVARQMRARVHKLYDAPQLSLSEHQDQFYDLVTPRAVGDRLWVREAWRVGYMHDEVKPSLLKPRTMTVLFEAGGSLANQNDGAWKPDPSWPHAGVRPDFAGKLRPSMFMPRWASRMTLIVTEVRIERLQDIRERDAAAEGLIQLPASARWVVERGDEYFGRAHHDPRRVYEWLWECINGPGSWDSNPWVIAYTFDVHKANIDALAS